jgi:4-alpha-glucanotransferase
VLHAIPALVRIDQANALAVNPEASEAEFDRAKAEIDRALTILEEAERLASSDHPVRGYLMVSKLAALRVWQVAITREKLVDPKRREQMAAFNAQARGAWLDYRHFVTCQLDRAGDPGIEAWRRLYQLAAPETPVACDRPPGR